MKKAFISAAAFAVVGVSSMAVAPTTSEAVPAFARQTGAACLSCHFQTFPAMTSMARAFKMGAFTDVGDEALVEDDNLSLPAVLNATFVLRSQHSNTRTTTGAVSKSTITWAVPVDTNLIMAGRVGSNTGAFVEFGGGAGDTGTAANNFQLLNSFDMGSYKLGFSIVDTGFGPTAGMELMSAYGQNGGKLNGKGLTAFENIVNGAQANVAAAGLGTGVTTTAVTGWAGSDLGVIAAGAVALTNAPAANNPSLLPMVYGELTTELGGAEAIFSLGTINGTQQVQGTVAGEGKVIWFGAQLQGELGDTSYGLYADYANASASNKATAAFGNLFVSGAAKNTKEDGYSFRLDVKPLHNMMFGVGFGSLKLSGPLTSIKQSTINVATTYEIYQNLEFSVSYDTTRNNGFTKGSTKKHLLLDLEGLF